MLSAGRVVKDAPQSRLKAMSPENVKKFRCVLCVTPRSCVKCTFDAEDAEVRKSAAIATLSRGFVVDYLDLFQRDQPVGDQAVQHG